jgi:hypothetical protein
MTTAVAESFVPVIKNFINRCGGDSPHVKMTFIFLVTPVAQDTVEAWCPTHCILR